MIKLIDLWETCVCNVYLRDGSLIESTDMLRFADTAIKAIAPYKNGVMVTLEVD